MPRFIHPHGLRYQLAQLALRLLYGRRWHSFSPFPKVATSNCIFSVSRNRILLALRAGNIENVGCWSGIGGFVELKARETYPQAGVREMWEETGLLLDITKFPVSPHAVFLSYDQVKKDEFSDIAGTYYFFSAPDDLMTKLELTEETADFRWFTEKECEAMIVDGRIPADFTDQHAAIRELFRRLRAGEKFPPLPL